MMTLRRGALAMAASTVVLIVSAPIHASAGTTLGSYGVAAMASGMQMTYDYPAASFHPQADTELAYAQANVDPTTGHALASLQWPGAAGGNAGSLIGVLGYPPVPLLNDPVRAEAFTGGTTQQTTAAPSGTVMSASVVPEPQVTQEANSLTTTAGTPLGGGSLGASSAQSKMTLTAGKLVAMAQSMASKINIGGVIKIGSITSSATAQSLGGATPTGSTTMTVHDFSIAGQPAYVDGSGVHTGSPGKQTNPETVGIVDKVLAGAGMQIYFTAAREVLIAGNSYDYAASVLVYWAPPGDSHGDVFTFSFGGAAVAMQVSQGGVAPAVPAVGGPPPVTPVSGAPLAAIPPSPAPTTLSLPTSSVAAPSLPAPTVSPAPAQPSAPVQFATPIGATSRGVGAPWFILLAALAGLAAVFVPRAPALLGNTTACAGEQPYPPRGT